MERTSNMPEKTNARTSSTTDEGDEQEGEKVFDSDSDSPASELDIEDNGQKFEDPDIPVADIFKELIERVRNFDKTNKDRLSSLIEDELNTQRDHLEKKTDQSNTILHLIAEAANKNRVVGVSNFQHLISELTKRHPSLPRQKDEFGLTPLHAAVKLKVERIVSYMSDALGDALDEIVCIEDNRREGNNCLHTAVMAAKSKSSIIRGLIPRIKYKDTVHKKNFGGLTPMHLAVDYEYCSQKQMNVVREMIQDWDTKYDILDVNVLTDFTGEYGQRSNPLSVFRHHQWSREQSGKEVTSGKYLAKPQASRKQTRNPINTDPSKEKLHKSEPLTDVPQLIKLPVPHNGPKAIQTPSPAFPRGSNVKKDLHIQGLQRQDTSLEKMFQKHEGYQEGAPVKTTPKRPNKHEKTKANAEEAENKALGLNQEEAADRIGDMLKMYYMCTRDDHTKLLSFLYGPKEVKQICLSFAGNPAIIHHSWLDRMRYANFDETLHYLEIPYAEVKRRIQSPNSEAHSEGRRDYVSIFKWLKEKGVKRIIQLSVKDYHPLPHSDESIELALKDIEVIQTWDWCKPDIDSDTLLTAAPGVQEVVLYWSGNNAVLRGWSAPDGLHKLQRLQKITIHGLPGLETTDRAQKHLDDFKSRMEKLRGNFSVMSGHSEHQVSKRTFTISLPHDKELTSPKIEIELRLEKTPPTNVSKGNNIKFIQHNHPQDQKWIACMKKFNMYAQDCLKNKQGSKAITIALIDDGVDFTDEGISGMIKDGRSYFKRTSSIIDPYWTSSGGHGTAMAGLIRTICPVAQLFVIRLNEYISESGSRQIVPESAATAIHAAIAKKVDIISMSWTIDRTETNEDGIKKLNDAVDAASKAQVLMFCAASDQGVVSPDNSFPGKSRQCFKIGAATAWGTAQKFVGTGNIDYIFPGHNIVQEHGRERRGESATLLTGSSAATALAAGLAALVLRCVQFAAQYYSVEGDAVNESQMYKHLADLKNKDRMENAFEEIRSVTINNTRYIQVWNVFDDPGIEIEHRLPQNIEKRMLNIAKRLVRKEKLESDFV